MAVGKIYIDGEIYPESYIWPGEVATSMVSVRNQVTAMGEVNSYQIIINSFGGYCSEGWAIYDYLKTLSKPVETVAIGQCCSIATVIFSAGSTRLVSPNCEFMIHQASGGAYGTYDEILQYAEQLRAETAKIVTRYAESTGIDEALISEMMAVDCFLPASDVVSKGFATGLFIGNSTARKSEKKQPFLAINLAGRKENPKTKNHNTMSKIDKALADAVASIKAIFDGNPVVNKSLTLENGTTIDVESTGDMPVLGDPVKVGADTAPDGDYTTADGKILTVTGGVITGIETKETETTELNTSASAETDTAKITRLENELIAIKAQNKQIQDRVNIILASKTSADIATTPQGTKAVAVTEEDERQKMLEERKNKGKRA